MNIYVLTAGILCFALGIAHSILGEYLIFKSKRHKGNLIPSKGSPELKERHVRILWATWHLTSVFGWSLGGILVKISLEQSELNSGITSFILTITMYAMFLASILVLTGTKGKHPGWIVLLIIGLLLVFAN